MLNFDHILIQFWSFFGKILVNFVRCALEIGSGVMLHRPVSFAVLKQSANLFIFVLLFQYPQATGEHPQFRRPLGFAETHRFRPQFAVWWRSCRSRQEEELQEGTGR